ncbi:hypothetical protein B0T10DRAFT_558185 [Thelonectria olida]|uniref:TIL domain-containing protein n=1 Tax=Thelonectria olida TaxID=1576542 RepID=A0A9P8WFC4_9HYPO|nr:hypothetical protein B0T10DRAFT_558185 [Thelonectria olida]
MKFSASIVTLFIAGALALPATTPTKCTGGKVWTDCGSPCPPTCQNPNPVCIQMCVEACQCPTGFVANSAGRCVKLASC